MNIAKFIFGKKHTATACATEQQAGEAIPLDEKIIEVLRDIYDPELPVNIYDLGLIYQIDIKNHSKVFIRMTLTAPGCPVADSLVAEVENAIKVLKGVSDAQVELVWDPPWNQDNLSDEVKLALGLF